MFSLAQTHKHTHTQCFVMTINRLKHFSCLTNINFRRGETHILYTTLILCGCDDDAVVVIVGVGVIAVVAGNGTKTEWHIYNCRPRRLSRKLQTTNHCNREIERASERASNSR